MVSWSFKFKIEQFFSWLEKRFSNIWPWLASLVAINSYKRLVFMEFRKQIFWLNLNTTKFGWKFFNVKVKVTKKQYLPIHHYHYRKEYFTFQRKNFIQIDNFTFQSKFIKINHNNPVPINQFFWSRFLCQEIFLILATV